MTVRRGFYQRNDVDIVHGTAHFIGDHMIEVQHGEGTGDRYVADAFILAVGSRPTTRRTSTSPTRAFSTATRS